MKVLRALAAALTAGGLLVGALVAASPAQAALTWDYGELSASGANMVLTYPDSVTVTGSMVNGGGQFSWLTANGDTQMSPYVGGSLATAYTPNDVVNSYGITPFLHGGDVCPSSTALGATTTCAGVVPVITFTFSQPVTDWKISINDLGGFSSGVTLFANWVVTTGQSLTFLSGDGNFQVTGGDTIKVVTPPTSGDANATGIGAGTVRVNGTYSTVSFRLDYFLSNQSGADPYVVNAGAASPPDAMPVQWSGQKPVAPAPTPAQQYTLSYDGNGGTCSAASQTADAGTWLNVNSGASCTRPGYVFAGWNTSAAGTGTNFGPNAPTQMTGNAVLYAKWTPVAAPAPAVRAVDDAVTTPFDTPVSGSAAGNDSYPAGSVFTKTSDPANGTAVMNPDGTFTYTPKAGFTGTDSFTYRVCAPAPNQAVCATATVRITVQASTKAPEGRPVTETVKPGSTKPLEFLPLDRNDPGWRPPREPGTIEIARKGTKAWGNKVVVPGKGVWVLKGQEVFFTPAPEFIGKTTIRYRLQARNGRWAFSTFTARAAGVPSTIDGGRAR